MTTKSRVCVARTASRTERPARSEARPTSTREKARTRKGNHLWPQSRRLRPRSSTEAELVEKHLPLVRTVVARLAMTLPPHVDSEDLYSAGLGGLADVVRHNPPHTCPRAVTPPDT